MDWIASELLTDTEDKLVEHKLELRGDLAVFVHETKSPSMETSYEAGLMFELQDIYVRK